MTPYSLELARIERQVERLRSDLALLKGQASGRRANTVVEKVAAAFGVDSETITGLSREAHAVRARRYAIHLHRRRGMSLKSIGQVLHRHHSTVLYELRQVQEEIQQDPSLAYKLGRIEMELANQ